MYDDAARRKFLIDTGARVSALPATDADRQAGCRGPELQAANKSSIKTFGTRIVPVSFYGHNYRGNFYIADVAQAIIGADFLEEHQLLVDVHGQRIIDKQR
ncbi:Hypothetical predicted protein, partial [Paramuricea clavata]